MARAEISAGITRAPAEGADLMGGPRVRGKAARGEAA